MRKQLGQMLIEAGAIDEAALRSALADQRRWGRPLGKTLVEMRLIREDDLVRILGQQLGLPSVDLDKVAVPKHVLELVPGPLAFQHNIVPFAQPMKFLDVAMLDPTNLGIADELRIRTQLNIRPYLAGPKMIERALHKYYGASVGIEPELEVAVQHMASPRSRTPTQERESVSINSPRRSAALRGPAEPDLSIEGVGIAPELRDGLKPYPARASQPQILPPEIGLGGRDKEIEALQQRISKLEGLVARDENVLRKLLALLIEKGLATREEIVERLS